MFQKCIWDGCNALGESPIWDPHQQCLYWIDMSSALLNCLELETGKYTTYKTDEPLCSIALCNNGNLLATTKYSISLLKQPDFKGDILLKLDPEDEHIIFNDGKCDAQGRFWIGTRYTLLSRPVSKLYQFSASNGLRCVVDNLIVSNGLGWSPDNRRFYLTDTLKKTIYRYAFDVDKGILGPG